MVAGRISRIRFNIGATFFGVAARAEPLRLASPSRPSRCGRARRHRVGEGGGISGFDVWFCGNMNYYISKRVLYDLSTFVSAREW